MTGERLLDLRRDEGQTEKYAPPAGKPARTRQKAVKAVYIISTLKEYYAK